MRSKKKLFCIPYAGSSAMLYSKWRSSLNENVELIPLELAGRGRRFSEPFYTSFDEAVEDLYNEVKKYDLDDYAILGHSMGSWLAVELAYRLEEKPPQKMFLAGNWPPHMQRIEAELHKMCDEEFKNEILRVGGTPKELFENKEILEFFMPILRADYTILEKYNGPNNLKKITEEIVILNGIEDDVTKEELRGWQSYTNSKFDIYEFEGGHFFINEKSKEVIDLINKKMK